LENFKEKNFDLVVVQELKFKVFEERLKVIGLPVVSKDWVKECLVQERYVLPLSWSMVKVKQKKRSK